MKKQKQYLLYGFGLLNVFVVAWFWKAGSWSTLTSGFPFAWIALGRLAGLLLVLSTLLQVLLMSRAPWMEKLFGFDRLAQFHRYNGEFLTLFLIGHPVFLVLGYQSAQTGFFKTFVDLIFSTDDILHAFIASLMLIGVIFLSISLVKKRLKYEWWYVTHLTVYAAILLSFGHQTEVGGDFFQNTAFVWYWNGLYAFVFANLLYFRFLRPYRLFKKHEFYVDTVKAEVDNSVSVYIKGKNLKEFSFEPGQFAIWRFLSKGFWWQAHPFSFSIAQNGEYLRITVKALGDFTSAIKNIPVGTKVIVDGPHGIFTPNRAASKKILLIAGGVGITPIRSMLEYFATTDKDVTVLYGSRKSDGIILKDEIDALGKRSSSPVYYVMSNDPEWEGEKGILDREKIKKLVTDVTERDIYVCGPPRMMKGVIASCKLLGVQKKQIYFEKFSL